MKRYEPIWTGLDPENRTAELMKVLDGATFVGRTEYWWEEGSRDLLVFSKEGWGELGLACREEPMIGGPEAAWFVGQPDAATVAWGEAAGRTVDECHGTTLGDWWQLASGAPEVHEPKPALWVRLGDMAVVVAGGMFILRAERGP